MELNRIDNNQLKVAIARRVEYLMNNKKHLFFSSLYRMDIAETDIQTALNSKNPIEAFSEMIYERQLSRIKSKKSNPVNAIIHNLDLQW